MIVGYYDDGPNLISMAMNGWGAAEPAWWLNLVANPEAVVELAGGIRREVLGRAAVGFEREQLWQRWRELDKNLDGYAALRAQETAVVVLEPRTVANGGIDILDSVATVRIVDLPRGRGLSELDGAALSLDGLYGHPQFLTGLQVEWCFADVCSAAEVLGSAVPTAGA